MDQDPNCIFCKIIAGEIPAYKIYEDDDFLAFLDIRPNNLGHTLLVPKTHCDNIFDYPADLLEKLGSRLQIVARAILAGAEAEAINIGMNNGEAAGQLVHHAHAHIIPRYAADGLDHWKQKEGIPEEEFEQMMEKIKQNI